MGFLTKGMTIPTRRLLAVAFLFASSFAWFFVFYTEFDEMISPGSLRTPWHQSGLLLLLASIGISALIGSLIAERVNRRKLLFLWLILGIVATAPIALFHGDAFLAIWGIIAGMSIGVGFPSCQAYLASSTTPDERGRVSGIAISVTFVLIIISVILIQVLELEATGILALTLALRAIGFLSFGLDPVSRPENKTRSWQAIFSQRDFSRYSLAFVLFMIAAGLVSVLWNAVPDDPFYGTAQIIRYVGLTVVALIAGLMADRIGRKKPIIFGLAMLGGAYAIVALLPSLNAFYVNLILSGFAWGIIIVIYLVVPGDLAFPGSEERLYTVGWVLPLVMYVGVSAVATSIGVAWENIAIFSMVLTMALFAAIIPLLYAVETLSESKMRERKLKEHAERIGKMVQESQETDEE